MTDYAAASPRFFRIALGLFILFAAAMGWQPHYREDWLLENVLTLTALISLVASQRRLPLSRASYLLILAFGILHTIGSHYTYSEVPYAEWLGWATSPDDGSEAARNHYDRLVHFACGLLLFHPLREIARRAAGVGPVTGYLYPLALLATLSHCYELIEWAAAEVFGGELGMAYLGTQGDIWDAQKDMALAFAGALLGAVFDLAWQRARSRQTCFTH